MSVAVMAGVPSSFSGPPLSLSRPPPFDHAALLPRLEAGTGTGTDHGHDDEDEDEHEDEQQGQEWSGADSHSRPQSRAHTRTPTRSSGGGGSDAQLQPRPPTQQQMRTPRANHHNHNNLSALVAVSAPPTQRRGALARTQPLSLSPRYARGHPSTDELTRPRTSPASSAESGAAWPARSSSGVSPRKPAQHVERGQCLARVAAAASPPPAPLSPPLRKALLAHQLSASAPSHSSPLTSGYLGHDATAAFLAHSPQGRAIARAEALARVDAVIRARLDEAAALRNRSQMAALDALYTNACGAFDVPLSPRPPPLDEDPEAAPYSSEDAAAYAAHAGAEMQGGSGSGSSRARSFLDPVARFKKLSAIHARHAAVEAEARAAQEAQQRQLEEARVEAARAAIESDRRNRVERARRAAIFARARQERAEKRAADEAALAQSRADADQRRQRDHAKLVSFIQDHHAALASSPEFKDRSARTQEAEQKDAAAERARQARWESTKCHWDLLGDEARRARAALDAAQKAAAEDAAAAKRAEAARARRARDERILRHMVELTSAAESARSQEEEERRQGEAEAARRSAEHQRRTAALAEEGRRKAVARAAAQEEQQRAQRAEAELRQKRLDALASTNIRAALRANKAASPSRSPSRRAPPSRGGDGQTRSGGRETAAEDDGHVSSLARRDATLPS